MNNCFDITFNKKRFKVLITINKPQDELGYHYNIELATTEQISGEEFQKLKNYLEEEGYVT